MDEDDHEDATSVPTIVNLAPMNEHDVIAAMTGPGDGGSDTAGNANPADPDNQENAADNLENAVSDTQTVEPAVRAAPWRALPWVFSAADACFCTTPGQQCDPAAVFNVSACRTCSAVYFEGIRVITTHLEASLFQTAKKNPKP